MNERILTNVQTSHNVRTQNRAITLRERLDQLRTRITKTIGDGWDAIQAQREIRQEK